MIVLRIDLRREIATVATALLMMMMTDSETVDHHIGPVDSGLSG
jgi:hypothetical protein